MIGRLPLRTRLALAFTAAMAVLLGVAALFLVLSFANQLDRGDDRALDTRADDVAAFIVTSEDPLDPGAVLRLSEDESGFTQVVSPLGEVLAASPQLADRSVLDGGQLAAAAEAPQRLDFGAVRGVEGGARVLARPVTTASGVAVIVVGSSREERDEAVSGLIRLLVIGGPIALLAAGGLGYLLAAAALRPVESMRRRAGEISGDRTGVRLPLPEADDELRRLGTTINAMLDRVDEAIGREREFVADASHELRTPLAILKSEIELALNGDRSAEELRAALVSANEETNRLERLAEDLLIISRADRGRLPVRLERLDATRGLERVTERMRPAAAREGRAIEVRAPSALSIIADPLRLDQALTNLLDNALRHGAGDVVVSARQAGARLQIRVCDEGDGPPAEIAERAFERFVRGAESRASGGGAGLGLPIVRAIAEAHEGTVGMERTADGFCVTLDLPAEAA